MAAGLLVPAVAVLVLLDGAAFWWYFAALLVFKLVANAVDGIIARMDGDSSKLGMVLNVSTDLVPDMAVSAIALLELGIGWEWIAAVAGIQACYLASELAFIAKFDMQNLYFGKDLRTLFFVLLGASAVFAIPDTAYATYYAAIFLLHQSGYHPVLRNRMARRILGNRNGGLPVR